MLCLFLILVLILVLYTIRSRKKFPGIPGAGLQLPFIGHYQVCTVLLLAITKATIVGFQLVKSTKVSWYTWCWPAAAFNWSLSGLTVLLLAITNATIVRFQ
jgi:hypothetical protein